MLAILMVLPIAAVVLAAALIWAWKGGEQPISSGIIIFIISLIAAILCFSLLEGLGQLGLGIIMLIPILIISAVGVIFLLVGLAKGRRQAVSNLKKVAKIVLEDPHS